MKYLLLLFLFGCSYNDICPNQKKIKEIDNQIRVENHTLQQMSKLPPSVDSMDDMVEQIGVIESLQIERLSLSCN